MDMDTHEHHENDWELVDVSEGGLDLEAPRRPDCLVLNEHGTPLILEADGVTCAICGEKAKE
jgi:hypothetical protein